MWNILGELKIEGKGGWSFVEIPMPKTSFGMLKVKGKEQTKADRIAKTIIKVLNEDKFY
ncbi:hypothetical protein NXY11_05825 [Parabacteroides faecis]|uniref:hypothetical protein n=1 Tax=Parabacteroides faecis TaxID=1217282 RepID=UPI002164CFD9|nr:hypothetical protein [Parabacteroides faecis]MCS2893650.1 hypothetical protein [Parabacteroides faecis]UVQ47759.1 hypothetical protein NXY11_05825 [Parabacteroides faecis]